MTYTHIIPPASIEYAEATLDEILIGLLAGEPEAQARWLTEAPALLRQAPEYNVIAMIGTAIQGGRAFDEQFAPAP